MQVNAELARGLEPLTARFPGGLAWHCSLVSSTAPELRRKRVTTPAVAGSRWTAVAITRGVSRGPRSLGCPFRLAVDAEHLDGSAARGLAIEVPTLYPLFMADMTDLLELRSDLTAVLARLDRMISARSTSAPADAGPPGADVLQWPRTKAIEWVLDHEGKPLRPVQIWAALQALGRDDPKMEVQVTTFDLWKRGRIGKVGRGEYRALDPNDKTED